MAGDIAPASLTGATAAGAMNLAIQAAISPAFKNPEVIRMMGKRDPAQLRKRIGEVAASAKLGKISAEEETTQTVELLSAIRKLGGKVSADEIEYINSHGSDALKDFEKVSSTLAGVAALNLAGAEVSAAKQ